MMVGHDPELKRLTRELAADASEADANAAKAESQPLHTFPFTDTGNAERFAARFDQDFRYCGPERAWYAWTGTRWETDKTGRTMRAAKTVVRELYAEAAGIEDQTLRTAAAGWARKCESLDRLRSMLTLAQSEGRIPVEPDSWNRDGWLLNCENGTVDLRTGELRPHRREDLITRLAPAEYDPAARHQLWDRFIEDSAGDDADFAEFLQRAAGYSATGDTREEKLFMVLGPTGSGKSTFLEALKSTLGDYSRVADFETFIQKRDAGVRNDIAALAGRRLVVSIEVEEGKKLAEGLVKSLTGRDTIAARFLHQEFFEFRPQFKLWLAANDAPKVKHHDEAIWRRILRVPFDRTVPASRRDPTLKDRLCQLPECRRAILAWAVEGCLRWQEDGLQEPERVTRATEAYREAQNPLRDFVDDRCELDPEALTPVSRLRRAYEAWAEDIGFSGTLSPNRFAEALKSLGCEAIRIHSGRYWKGIGLTGQGA